MRAILILLVFLFVNLSQAQDKNQKVKTLDFEGEVIEGEAMRPMLYLQIESPDLDLNNILYQRKDFNDFHKIDKVRRNRFIPDSR
ncbi:MAG: hypothetical protein ACK5V3_02620 [Bdellovibrionales bacterium]